jgi:hypothetical protein
MSKPFTIPTYELDPDASPSTDTVCLQRRTYSLI